MLNQHRQKPYKYFIMWQFGEKMMINPFRLKDLGKTK